MFHNPKFLYCFLIIWIYQLSFAQENTKPVDSAKMYISIEKYSKKNKFTTFMHKLIFEPVVKQKKNRKHSPKTITKKYSKSEGKIIREINITTLDPFGYSEIDTTRKPKSFSNKTGNFLHIKTNNLAIKNLLLIKKNEPLDSLLVKESERLIRSQRYIRRVLVNVVPVAQSSDSVDVFIRVMDSWTIIPDLLISPSKYNFRLTERNFLGTGHEFSNSYTKSLNTNQYAFETNYFIPNVLNTFVGIHLNYEKYLDGNYFKSINIERPFYSPYTRWAGGVNLGQQLNKLIIAEDNPIIETQNFKYNFEDYWAGVAFQIFKGNSEHDRATNFITTVRYFNKKYVEKPILSPEKSAIYSDEKLYLISFGISSRKYVQDKYVFNFNVTEDIAKGFVYSITSGTLTRNNEEKFYAGAKFAKGNYFEFGYLGGNIEYGTFFKHGKTIQSTAVFQLIYFTNLLETGKWKFRQFIKPQLIIGNNQIDESPYKLTLNGDTGIQGFNSETLFGSKKLLVTFQTQAYPSWRVIGFHLNPYFIYSMGMIGQNQIGFTQSKLYSQIGLGFIISNEYLVFSSFQLSFSYYPIITADGNSTFKSNAIRTGDFGLQDFEIGKPSLVQPQ